jgi:hypothetical protein
LEQKKNFKKVLLLIVMAPSWIAFLNYLWKFIIKL